MIWSDFLDTANRLIAGATEGDWRSAISRSYYAIFHYFREWLLLAGVDVGNGPQAHHNLYAAFLHCGVPAVASIARRIDDLRTARNRADYDIARAMPRTRAAPFVVEASSVVAAFHVIISGGTTATIAYGVKQYLISVGRIPNVP